MPVLQALLHRVEVTVSHRWFRYVPALLAVLLVAVVYDLREFRNFSTVEAMDAAQLGRRISEGKGYTTQFIRPLSLDLLRRDNGDEPGGPTPGEPSVAAGSLARPDISNPPVYPVVLAGLMKVLPFNYTASSTEPFWSSGGRFLRYEPDFLIALFNQLLFAAVIALAFFWALRLFDAWVAWTSAVVLLGTESLWRFSVSGLSTMLLLLLFMALVWILTLFESEAREFRRGPAAALVFAVMAGLVVGLGGLTRYSFACMILPTLGFVLLFAKSRRPIMGLAVLLAFGAVMVPWLVRNWLLCGAPFGTASYRVLEGTALFPGHHLERSLNPNLQFFLAPIRSKFFANLPPILQHLTSSLGGGWIGAFFLVGLMVGFRRRSLRRLRYFLMTCLVLLIAVEALVRTQASVRPAGVNADNLLVILSPLVVVYGVSLFFTLLEAVNLPGPGWRAPAAGVFGIVVCLPMIFALFTRTSPLVYPPYHPLLIQQTAAWMKPDEALMSDIPWAVAWYGDRSCVWLTLNAVPDSPAEGSGENFFAMEKDYAPIHGLYLTQETTGKGFESGWLGGAGDSWGHFVLDVILKKEVPMNFPLHEMPTGYLPEQVFLSDWKRWQ